MIWGADCIDHIESKSMQPSETLGLPAKSKASEEKDIRRLVIVGGKLQGIEAAYLGKKAGMEVTLIDRCPDAAAQKLCDRFICADVLSGDPEVEAVLEKADMILPANENYETLDGLVSLCESRGYILAFDPNAYRISSSKTLSNKLFEDHGFPLPKSFPGGDAPYIVKPDGSSGSRGVKILAEKQLTEETVHRASQYSFGPNKILNEKQPTEEKHLLTGSKTRAEEKRSGGYVIQEFLEGPTYSVEVIGKPGNYRVYDVTQTFMDDSFDCKKAEAIRDLPAEKEFFIKKLGVQIAEILSLKGIMDLEVVDHNGEIRILEIDARFPSQTPIVVYHASGINYIEELYDLFSTCDFGRSRTDKTFEGGGMGVAGGSTGFASIAHMLINKDGFTPIGEHIMTEGGPLRLFALPEYNAEMISDISDISDLSGFSDKVGGPFERRAMFICKGTTLQELEKNERMMYELLNEKQDKNRPGGSR